MHLFYDKYKGKVWAKKLKKSPTMFDKVSLCNGIRNKTI